MAKYDIDTLPPPPTKLNLATVRTLVEERGAQIYTASDLWSVREDYVSHCPVVNALMQGPCHLGWRWKLGGGTGTGKTTLAWEILRDHLFAAPDRVNIWVDAEHAQEGHPERSRVAGIPSEDPRVQILPWHGTGEGLFSLFKAMLLRDNPVPLGCVVIDSMHALTPMSEREGDTGAACRLAAMISDAMRKMTGLFARCHITQVWLLQRRSGPGTLYNAIGNALEHYADLDISFTGGIRTSEKITSADGEVEDSSEDDVEDEDEGPRTKTRTKKKSHVIGAYSTLTLTKKRSGDGTPYDSTSCAITFTAGLDFGLNLALALEHMGYGGISGYKIPCQGAGAQVMEELRAESSLWTTNKENETVPLATLKFDLVGDELRVKGNALARPVTLSKLLDFSPTLRALAWKLSTSKFRAPKKACYRGAFMLPTKKQLEALVADLEAGAELLDEA